MTRNRDQEQNALAQFNSWFRAGNPLFAGSLQLTDTLCTRAMAVSAELTGFTLARIQEDMRLPQKLAGCHSPLDVQQAWMEFWNKAFEQYQTEWSRLAGINLKPLPVSTAGATTDTEHRVRAAA